MDKMALEKKIQKWIVEDTHILSEGYVTEIPDISTFTPLVHKKNIKLWNYITSNVKSRHTVEHIKKILEYKRAKNDLFNLYPPAHRDLTLIKEHIQDAEANRDFIKTTYKHIQDINHILKGKIEVAKTANCKLMQKVSFFELEMKKYKQKQRKLNKFIVRVVPIISETFSVDRVRCFRNTVVFDPLNVPLDFIRFTAQSTESKIKNIMHKISTVIGKNLSNNEIKLLFKMCKERLNNIMRQTTAKDIVTVLKKLSKQAEEALKYEEYLAICAIDPQQKKEKLMSEKYLKDLKASVVDSFFEKTKMKSSSSKLENSQFDLSKVKSESERCQTVVNLTAQNVGLKARIEYLEKVLNVELDAIQYMNDKNDVLRTENEDLMSIMKMFYEALELMQMFFKTNRLVFAYISKALIASNGFLHNLKTPTNTETPFLDFQMQVQANNSSSLELLRIKKLLNGLLYGDSTSERAHIPDDVWNFLSMGNFKNWRLICKKLFLVTKEICACIEKCEASFDKIEDRNEIKLMTDKADTKLQMIVSSKTDVSTIVKDNSKCLETIVDEWFNQPAQFALPIIYEDKTLKMWLDILRILKDF